MKYTREQMDQWTFQPPRVGKSQAFPIIVLGWFSPSIIKRNLLSINLLEHVKPEIYFVENKSINSDKIKEIVASTPNVKGYIQFKENFAANVWKIALEHFFNQIEEEYVTLTDGDYVYGCNSMSRQREIFNKDSLVGVVSQRRCLVGVNGYWRQLITEYWDNGRVNNEEGELYSRNIRNGFLLTTARKSDWQAYIKSINERSIAFNTHALGNPDIMQYRPPLFFDTDMYRFFETVLGKKSISIKIDGAYHLTDEEHNDPDSEYNKAKGEFGYQNSWGSYQENPEFYHNKYYDDGQLKYEIII